MKFETKFLPSWDRRSERPNYGQHDMEIQFTLRGEQGTVVCIVQTGWYLSSVANWFDEMGYPNYDRVVKAPRLHEVNIHSRLTEKDMHRDASDIHDDCGYLDGEPCVVDHTIRIGETKPWLEAFIGGGPEAIEQKIRAFYSEAFGEAGKAEALS